VGGLGMGIEYNCWCERTDASEIGFRLYGNYMYKDLYTTSEQHCCDEM
jgi:hypothetical protein